MKYICDVHYVIDGIDETKWRNRRLSEKLKKLYMDGHDEVIKYTNPKLET